MSRCHDIPYNILHVPVSFFLYLQDYTCIMFCCYYVLAKHRCQSANKSTNNLPLWHILVKTIHSLKMQQNIKASTFKTKRKNIILYSQNWASINIFCSSGLEPHHNIFSLLQN